MATTRRVHVTPRELKALHMLVVFDKVCPKSTQAAKPYESLIVKGLAKRASGTLDPRKMHKVKHRSGRTSLRVAYCYKKTRASLTALRQLLARQRS